MAEHIKILTGEAIELLRALVAIPSFSREEDGTAALLEKFFGSSNIPITRSGNNIIVKNRNYDPARPTILLNSHHDTVRPNPGYSRDPFTVYEVDGKLSGLGINDAGGALVSLIALFRYYYADADLPYNLILAATAEEEISGTGGIESILPSLPRIDFAIVGEPTQMQMAIAERGLMVMDAVCEGKAGHAARNEGENALYKALADIEWIRNYEFPKISDLLGPCKLNVTVIETENKAHNVVPATCHYVIDARINELYTFEEVLDIVRSNVSARITPRSTRLRSSIIQTDHPIVQAGIKMGLSYYGSPTTSDKALMPFPALKLGPGDSARSHTADEYIYVSEIVEGIELYIRLLKDII